MKRSILFLIMFMCMISVSAFAVDYSHDKSPPGVEVYQATTVASIDFDNIWLVEIPAITQSGEISFNLLNEVAIVEVVYIGDSYNNFRVVLQRDSTNIKLPYRAIRCQNEGLLMRTQYKHFSYSILHK